MAESAREPVAQPEASLDSANSPTSGEPEHPDRALPERVEPAWSEGRAMSPDEALEYALSSHTL